MRNGKKRIKLAEELFQPMTRNNYSFVDTGTDLVQVKAWKLYEGLLDTCVKPEYQSKYIYQTINGRYKRKVLRRKVSKIPAVHTCTEDTGLSNL